MGRLFSIRFLYATVVVCLVVTIFLPNQFAIISLVTAYAFTIVAELITCRVNPKKLLGGFRIAHFVIFTIQFGALIFFLLKGANQFVIWINSIVVIVVAIIGWFETGSSPRSLYSSTYIGHASVFLLGALLLFQADLDRRKQLELTHLNQELIFYHEHWSAKVDSISQRIKRRNPDPVLSIWTDLRRSGELSDQLAYSRKVITEHVTHDFFIEPDQLLKNRIWAFNTDVSTEWWLNSSQDAEDDYKYKGLKETFEDVTTYQRFRLESLNNWLFETASYQWFLSLENRSTNLSAIESTQGLLYLMGTVDEMIAHKLNFFESEQFDSSFNSDDTQLAELWRGFQEGNEQKNPVSFEWQIAIFILVILALLLPRNSLKILGASFVLFTILLLALGVSIVSVIWLPLIVFGVTSFFVDARKEVPNHEKSLHS
jgi:hypothetical protein